MDKAPNRRDEVYTEIEEFKDYELNNCIAYEMAIRNDNVKKLIPEFKNLDDVRKFNSMSMSDKKVLNKYLLDENQIINFIIGSLKIRKK